MPANGWNNVLTGAGGFSSIFKNRGSAVTLFGTTSGVSTLTLQFSGDGTTFYDSAHTISANGNFGNTFNCYAPYCRVKSSADVTATLYILGKYL